MSLAALLLASPLALAPSDDLPDLIVLSDGKEVECRVLYEDDERVLYTKRRSVEEVPRAEVASVQSIERSLREMFQRYDAMSGDDPAALLELSSFCDSRGLSGESYHLLLRVLTVDPENEEAWTRLGGSKHERRGWRLKVRGRYYTLDQLRERVADWKHAMEIPTAHFLVRTDMPPERALDLCLDVERAYLAFYDLLGRTLMLFPFDEVPEIQIPASSENYASPPHPGQVAWFSPSANTLYVDGEHAQSVPQAAVSELSDLLLFNAQRRTVGKTGSMPAWATNGIGTAFGGAFQKNPGHAAWDLSKPLRSLFVLHARAEKPLSLKDVVRSSRSAFHEGTDQELYVAESYTLAYFLAYGDDGAHRAAFGQYLVGAFGGQSSTTHLEKALGMKSDEIEAAWKAYVGSVAGI